VVVGKTTENMKYVRTFTDNTWSTGLTSPWDFVGNPYKDVENENIWDIDPAVNNGYPFFARERRPLYPPNKPTNMLPSENQTTTDVILSAVCVDNDNDPINVFFYDNADNSLIDNIWIASGETAQVVWGGLTTEQTYTFFTRGQDKDGWGENSDTQSFYIEQPSTLEATIDLKPEVLHWWSGKWVTCYIELPSGFDVADIVARSIRLEGYLRAESRPTAIGDYDSDGIPDLMVKFNRFLVWKLWFPGNHKLTVTGTLLSGVAFRGSDTIRVPGACVLYKIKI
jgi:hypothetical protein